MHNLKTIGIAVLASIALTSVALAQTALEFDKLTPALVTSPKGIAFWLLEERSRPVVSMRFSLNGGSWLDGADKAGQAAMAASLLNEGAGKRDTESFMTMMDDNAISIYYHASGENLIGAVSSLKRKLHITQDAVKDTLLEPRFDDKPFERTRSEFIAQIHAIDYVPSNKARHEWFKWQFKDSPAGIPSIGTLESVDDITQDDLRKFIKSILGLDKLKVSIVGNLNEKEAGELVDHIFSDLPKKAALDAPTFPLETQHPGETKVISQNSPQDKLVFGLELPGAQSKDFYAALLLSRYIGDTPKGALFREVRENMGLAYSAGGFGRFWKEKGLFFGRADVTKDNGEKAKAAIIDIFAQTAAGNIDEEMMERIRQHSIKSWPTEFVSSRAIASAQLSSQILGLSPTQHAAKIEGFKKPTLQDLKRVASKYFKPENLGILILKPTANETQNQ